MKLPHSLATLLIGFLSLLPCLFAESPKGQPAQQPPPVLPSLLVYRADWLNRLPPHGGINYPGAPMQATAPGERLVVVILSGGIDTEPLGDKVTYDLSLRVGDQLMERKAIRPDMERRVKGEGSDFILEILQSAGTNQDEMERLRQKTLMNSFAFFTLGDWCVPVVPERGELVVEATWTQEGKTQRIASLRIPILSITEW